MTHLPNPPQPIISALFCFRFICAIKKRDKYRKINHLYLYAQLITKTKLHYLLDQN